MDSAQKKSGMQLPQPTILPTKFYTRSTTDVARALLGKRLVSHREGVLTAGWIVETEAYLPESDSACHSTRGETRGNRSMFGAAGRAYVYPIHSRHCFNVVTQQAAEGTAVLVRAVQPVCGITAMMRRRGNGKPVNLCRGPGRLCEAMGIDRSLDGHQLTLAENLWIDDFDALNVDPAQIKVTERIGVTSAKDLPLRFVVAGSRYVSGPLRMR
mgnify:CR=1 FL=1